jgi:hypothetical protein
VAYAFRRQVIKAVEVNGAKGTPEYVAVHIAAATECFRRYYAVGKALADRGLPEKDADATVWLAMNDRVIRYLESAGKHLQALGLDRVAAKDVWDCLAEPWTPVAPPAAAQGPDAPPTPPEAATGQMGALPGIPGEAP